MNTFDRWASESLCNFACRCATRARLVAIVWASTLGFCLAFADSTRPCEVPVAGSPSDWHHKGKFKGYRVEVGCADSPVVVAGSGKNWLEGVPPSEPSRKRLSAVTGFYSRFLDQHRKEIASWNGFSQGRTCATDGVFPIVVLQNWRDVDLVSRLAGEALASAGLKERVGIRLSPFSCSEPTKLSKENR